MDTRDVALWVVFALTCALPAPPISRRTLVRDAFFPDLLRRGPPASGLGDLDKRRRRCGSLVCKG